MTGMTGLTPGSALLARIRAGQVGGVILFGRNIGSRAELTGGYRRAAGGRGRGREPSAPDRGRPGRRLGQAASVRAARPLPGRDRRRRLHGQGALGGSETAGYLRSFGIDVDLAPVLDTPYSPKSFLGTRAFSRNPRTNAAMGKSFIQGLQAGGVAATAKHFPGLGTARTSTDDRAVILTTSQRSLAARLPPFEQAIGAKVDLVMVSNAGYAAYDPTGTPAVLSRPIVTGLLRQQLGFWAS